MTPTRRAILATGSSCPVAGCVASTITDDGDPPKERELTSVTTSVPDEAPISVEVSRNQRLINPGQTASFDLRLTWRGDDPVTYRFGSNIPFGEPKYSDEPAGLILLNRYRDRQNDQTWLPKTGENGHVGGPQSSKSRELSPGESVAGTWHVWGDPREVSHIEPGNYRFEDKTTPRPDGPTYSWEFTTRIEQR